MFRPRTKDLFLESFLDDRNDDLLYLSEDLRRRVDGRHDLQNRQHPRHSEFQLKKPTVLRVFATPIAAYVLSSSPSASINASKSSPMGALSSLAIASRKRRL